MLELIEKILFALVILMLILLGASTIFICLGLYFLSLLFGGTL